MKDGVSNKTRKKPKDEIEVGSGNVFADLGLPNPGSLLLKAELVHCICVVMEERGLSLVKTASLLGIEPAKLSALTRGKLDSFPADRLFEFLNALDQDVEIRVHPKRRSAREASTKVLAS